MFEDALPDLSDEQRMILDSATRFVQETMPYEKRRAAVQAGTTVDREIWSQMAELGWLGLWMDEDAGGFGGSALDASLICEALGKGQVLEPFSLCGVFPGRLLSRLSGDVVVTLIEGIVSGETLAAVAWSEPQARGDVLSVETTATGEGTNWRLNGHKSLVVGGDVADILLVTARQPDGTIALYKVDRDADGVSRKGLRLHDWTSGVDVRFANTPAQLLAAGDDLVSALKKAADETIMMLCSEAVGAIEGAIDLTSAYIKERKQYGVTLSSFQALQHRVADMTIELVLARAAVARALTYLDSDETERAAQVSGCKVLVARIGRWATGQGIQLHGGYGITEEYQVGQYLKRLIIIDALFGSRDVHLAKYREHMMQTLPSA